MTERRWLTCIAPTQLITYYDKVYETDSSVWRMLICAFAHLAWDNTDHATRVVVEAQEKIGFSKNLVNFPYEPSVHRLLKHSSAYDAVAAAHMWKGRLRDKADLVRCVLGNAVKPTWLQLRWLTPDVLALVKSCGNPMVLADAAEEAGVPQRILDHLRHAPWHSRYCHVRRLLSPL